MIYSYQHGTSTHQIQIDPQPDGTFRARINGREYIVRASQTRDGAWQIMLDDGARQVRHTASDGRARFVKAGDVVYSLQKTTGGRRTASHASGERHLVAQMPAQVSEVTVKQGDMVSAGQTLLILEAMKMEIRVTAPHDGIVTHLFVQKGDVVERDQQLIDIRENTQKEEEN